MPAHTRRAPRPARHAAAVLAALAVLACAAPTGPGRTALDGDGQCAYPAHQIKGTPWSLQRVPLDQMWRYGRGEGVRVAVVDTGVDNRNPQLTGAVDSRDGIDLITPGGDGTDDTVGHGTEVAGIIAARPAAGTGFVGIAPRATIIPVRQNDAQGDGTTATLAEAVRRAADAGAGVINISQDTVSAAPDAALATAVGYALRKNVVVVASAGNDGTGGQRHTTYPAAYPGVLAVGASDRADERADFSQVGAFVGVAAPGVDMVSTVPIGGQCVDSGTSFSAPYVAGVAALIRGKHPTWTEQQVVAQIEETADRTGRGRDDFTGWGVVDPVRALTDDAKPIDHPVPGPPPAAAAPVRPAAVTPVESPRARATRTAGYALAGAVVLLAVIIGGAVVVRDARRRRAGTG